MKNILDQDEPMSFEEMIKAAMLKSTIPTREWEKAVRALGKQEKTARRKKRWLAAAASISVIILFFAATPIGRAWAKSAIEWVVRIFDDKIIVENINNDAPVEYEAVPEKPDTDLGSEQIETKNYSSVEQLYQSTELNPLIINNSDAAIEEVIYQEESADGALITIIYSSEKWGDIVTNQIWSIGEGFVAGLESEYEIIKVIDDDYEMYCCINPDDNLFEGRIISEEFIYTIGFKNQEENKRIIESIKFFDS